ncbi:MAG: flavin reductase family protein [Pseudomonadota bacterium]
MSDQDSRALRDAFGCFATGVCVVTTTTATNEPIGMTVNSFSSVSLEPPLVSWCVGLDASCFEHFVGPRPFNVHILAAAQSELSQAFARPEEQPFDTASWHRDERGVPVLDACPVRFFCTPREHVDAGDHVLILAAVNRFETSEQEPLLFYRSAYRGD